MRHFRTLKTSHLIAGISTLIIHVILAFVLSVSFSGEHSSHLSDEDLNLDMNLEEFLADDFDLNSKGNDPLSNNNNESESLSKEKGSVKVSHINPVDVLEPLPEEPNISDIDTVVEKIEEVHLLKVDTIETIVGDTIPIAGLLYKNPAQKSTKPTRFNSERDRYAYYQKNYKIIRNFRKVYPYALKTRELIENLNKELATISSDTEKKRLIKETEKLLFKEYEGAVRNMTISQGKLLLKLIARETNKTGYDIIKDYKGAFSASFWYGVGKIFGNDLKSEFHKEKEDSLIEDVLVKYQSNDLY